MKGVINGKTEGVKWFREEYPPAAALNRKADGRPPEPVG